MKVLWSLLLLGTLPMLAAGPFTGTWKIDISKAKFPQKPEKIELANGTYKCSTCDPPINKKRTEPISRYPATHGWTR